MEITISKKVSTKVDLTIEVPAYYSYGECVAKILNESEFIEVYPGYSNEVGIRKMDASNIVALFVHDGSEITEEKFNDTFNKVFSELQELTNLPSIEAVTNQR